MIENGIGGANTLTGLKFEKETDILEVLKRTPGYSVDDNHIIYFDSKEVARSFRKFGLYVYLDLKGVDYKKYISKRLLPDEALYVFKNNKVYIIELKFQKVAGSVDEKLQTCDFKKKQYTKIFSPLNLGVEYIYVLSDWFAKPEYKDTLDYIKSVGCHYYFKVLPLDFIGLPLPRVTNK